MSGRARGRYAEIGSQRTIYDIRINLNFIRLDVTQKFYGGGNGGDVCKVSFSL